MSDDLFKDCDCGDCGDCDCGDCGDCDCDWDCFDCDCNCDDCLPGNNFIVICCCIPPANRTNDANRTNRADASPDCCCCCERRHYSPRRRRRSRKKRRNKKGFCCWRLWWCFGHRGPSPPPSPPHPGPDERPPRGYMGDGRYPMPDDLEFYMNDRWDRHHELDMPPRGYRSGGRYPMPGEMRMYRDEYDPHGGKWNDPKDMRKNYRSGDRYGIREEERDARSKVYNYRRDGVTTTSRGLEDVRGKTGMKELDGPSTDYREHNRLAKKEDLGKATKDEKKDEENTRSVVQDVPPVYYHGHDHRQDEPDELEIAPYDYAKYDKYSSHGARASGSEEPRHNKPDDDDDDKDDLPRGFKGRWSGPVKYEEPGRQTKH